jgi:hypothetical protein
MEKPHESQWNDHVPCLAELDESFHDLTLCDTLRLLGCQVRAMNYQTIVIHPKYGEYGLSRGEDGWRTGDQTDWQIFDEVVQVFHKGAQPLLTSGYLREVYSMTHGDCESNPVYRFSSRLLTEEPLARLLFDALKQKAEAEKKG